MKRLALLILCSSLLFSGCSSQPPKIEYKRISGDQAKTIIENENVIILDVRTQAEFDEGHIENAILIPDVEIAEKAPKILTDKNAKILVYCRSGRRSQNASRELVDMGYTNVYDFGGIIDWKYEIVK